MVTGGRYLSKMAMSFAARYSSSRTGQLAAQRSTCGEGGSGRGLGADPAGAAAAATRHQLCRCLDMKRLLPAAHFWLGGRGQGPTRCRQPTLNDLGRDSQR